MEVQILYTIDYVVPHAGMVNTIKEYCDMYNIEMEETSKVGIYRFTGSYEWNIRVVQSKFNLKVYDCPERKIPITYKD